MLRCAPDKGVNAWTAAANQTRQFFECETASALRRWTRRDTGRHMPGQGTNPASLSVSPSSLAFELTTIGDVSLPAAFVVTNNGGSTTGALTVGKSGQNPNDFNIAGNTCTTLAPGASCVVTVTFQPTGRGLRTASISVSGTPGGSVSVGVSGDALPRLEILSVDEGPARRSQDVGLVVARAGDDRAVRVGAQDLLVAVAVLEDRGHGDEVVLNPGRSREHEDPAVDIGADVGGQVRAGVLEVLGGRGHVAGVDRDRDDRGLGGRGDGERADEARRRGEAEEACLLEGMLESHLGTLRFSSAKGSECAGFVMGCLDGLLPSRLWGAWGCSAIR